MDLEHTCLYPLTILSIGLILDTRMNIVTPDIAPDPAGKVIPCRLIF